MSFQDKINNLLAYSLVKIWVTEVKTRERLLNAKVKGGLKKANGQRVLDLVCKRRGEVLWQVKLTGTMRCLCEELMKIDDKCERPSVNWYKEN